MEFEDFAEPEIAITAAVAAALFSPRARSVVRKGLVYGVAGLLTAGDAVASFGQSVRQGMQRAGETTQSMAQEGTRNGGQETEEQEQEEAVQEAAPPLSTRRKPAARPGRTKGK